MTSLSCIRVVALLERREVGLSESERLRAESHLAECAECREQSRLLDGARRAWRSSQPGLSSSSREQVLRRAFEQSGRAEEPRVAGGASRLVPVLLLAAAVLLVGAFAWRWLRAPSVVAAHGLEVDAVESGQLSSVSGLLQVGARVPQNVPLETQSSARVHVSNAQVDAAAGSRIVWRPQAETLALDAGSVKVSVEHVEGRHFRVAAPSFVVDVVGTQFEVDPRGVRVTRGIVRVLGLDGKVLAVLPAGGAWSAAAPSSAAPSSAAATDGAVTAGSGVAPTNSNPAPAVVVPSDEGPSSAHAAPVASPAELLASARRSLAKGSATEAEKFAQSALGLHPAARDAAEARTLLAECAVARGNTPRAVNLYLDVARAYSTLPAGDNALFAAARLSERSGSAARAHDLFEQYLRQYPAGRFRSEAERHLRPVSNPTSTPPG